MIDAHCHLTGDEFDGLGGAIQVIARAKEKGVSRLIISGFDIPSSKRAKELAESVDGVYFTAGFHPSELAKYEDGDLQILKTLCQSEKCVAVGEIGLDYHFEDNPPKDIQKKLFKEQLALAKELGLPVVVHSRDACQDTLALLKENKELLAKGGLMHCYSYSKESVQDFLELGFSFSFGGPCTFKNAKKVYESVQAVPAHRLLTETDCPYLTPVPFRGVFPNEPKNIPYILERIAELKEMNKENLEKQVDENANALFFKLK